MKSEYTTFDTATDGGFKPTPPGIYPAHVSSFDSNPWNESVVFNLIFKLADDVKEVQVPTGEQNGDGNFHVNKDDDGKTIPVYQAIDQSKLVPILTKALQEAITKIETLETKVTALENK